MLISHTAEQCRDVVSRPLTTVMMAGIFNDVLWSFVVSFTAPYIMAHIGGQIGFIFGGVAIISLLFAILFLPELAGRSLEEVDELFEKPRFRWGWQFKGAHTDGVGARIAEIEAGRTAQLERFDSGQKGAVTHEEEVEAESKRRLGFR